MVTSTVPFLQDGAISYGLEWSPACVLLTAPGDGRVVEGFAGFVWSIASLLHPQEQHCEEASVDRFVSLVDGTWKYR
jgi:hypothetical protein